MSIASSLREKCQTILSGLKKLLTKKGTQHTLLSKSGVNGQKELFITGFFLGVAGESRVLNFFGISVRPLLDFSGVLCMHEEKI